MDEISETSSSKGLTLKAVISFNGVKSEIIFDGPDSLAVSFGVSIALVSQNAISKNDVIVRSATYTPIQFESLAQKQDVSCMMMWIDNAWHGGYYVHETGSFIDFGVIGQDDGKFALLCGDNF